MRCSRSLLTVACVIGMVGSTCLGDAHADDWNDEVRNGGVDDIIGLDDGFATRSANVPPIGEVLGAAYGAAGLDRDPAKGWRRRARLAGLVPWITVRTGRDTSWQQNDPDIDHGMAVEVRATWRLDRLVFDGRELQVATIDAARRRERRRLASRVIRVYFAWRRAAARPNAAGAGTRAEEAAAELDALTDGWFSDSLARTRRSASETRTP